MQAAPVNIVVGSHVWVEDPDLAWIDGEVSKINGHEVHVHTTNGKLVCSLQLHALLFNKFNSVAVTCSFLV